MQVQQYPALFARRPHPLFECGQPNPMAHDRITISIHLGYKLHDRRKFEISEFSHARDSLSNHSIFNFNVLYYILISTFDTCFS